MPDRFLSYAVVVIVSLWGCVASAAVDITIESPRRAFYRGEVIALRVSVNGAEGGTLSASLGDVVRDQVALSGNGAMLRLPTQAVRCGEYELTAELREGGEPVATTTQTFTIAMRPNANRLMVWLWGGGGNAFYREHGFTSWSGMSWNNLDENIDAMRKTLDEGLVAGADCLLRPNGGLRDLIDESFDDPDALYEGLNSWYTKRVAEGELRPLPNPFHPEVARRQNQANEALMQLARDYPQLRTAFFNTEVVDTMYVNRNEAGRRLMIETLGFDANKIRRRRRAG